MNPLTPTQAQLDANKKQLVSGSSNTGGLIPGINVGNLLKQAGSFVGLAPKGDYDIFDNLTVSDREGQVVANPFQSTFGTPAVKGASTTTPYNPYFPGATISDPEESYNQWLAQQEVAAAAQQAAAKANEIASYEYQISNLDRLLGYAATKKQQGIQGIEDEYGNAQTLQKKAFDTQRLQNTQNQEKGYGEVGNFANTSMNNLNRLLQGANAGRSSVGQVLAPYMVNRSAETRRKAVTDTAGENARNIDITSESAFQDLGNQRKKSLQDYESSVLGSQNELESQKRNAIINRGLASGQGYEQARAGASAIDASMNDRYAQLADLFSKYKPDYSIKEAPALSTYQVDPAQIKTQGQGTNDFYLNMLKRKKDLQQGV